MALLLFAGGGVGLLEAGVGGGGGVPDESRSCESHPPAELPPFELLALELPPAFDEPDREELSHPEFELPWPELSHPRSLPH